MLEGGATPGCGNAVRPREKKKKATVNTPNDGSHRNPLHLFTFSYDIEWEGVSFPGKTKGGQNSSHLSTALNPDCASESLQQEMIVEWCGCSRRCGQVFRLHQDVPTRIVFFCNTKLGLITKIPISGRDILPESILWSSWWRAAPMGGVSVSNSNPAPLLSTGPINVSAIRSAQLQNKEGRGGGGLACKHKEQGNSGRRGGERGEPGLSLTKVQAITAPHRWSMEANCQREVKSIGEQLIYFGAPQRSRASEKKKEKHGRQSWSVSLRSTQKRAKRRACPTHVWSQGEHPFSGNDLLVSLIACCWRGTIC